MRDRPGALKAGLRPVTEKTCLGCHTSTHEKPFDFAAAKARIAHPTRPESEKAALGKRSALARSELRATETDSGMAASTGAASFIDDLEVHYKNPVNLAFRPDGREVWVACEAAGSVVIVDSATRARVAEIPVGGQATDVAFSPDGTTAYVTARLDDSVGVVDVASRKVLRKIPVADEPHGVAVDPMGKTLFVVDTAQEAISVVDLATGKETKRLPASRYAWSAALSPDGRRLLVTNALSRFVPFRTAPISEVTVLDVAGQRVEDRWVVPEANLLLGVAWHPSGEFALATLNRTKNLVPMTRILQGWTITNGLAVLWKDGRVDQVLLDEPQRYFADVTDVAITPDGRTAVATSAGTDQVAVLDVERLVALVRGVPTRPARRAAQLAGRLRGVRRRAGPGEGQPPRDHGGAGREDRLGRQHARRLAERRRPRPAQQVVARVDLGGPRQTTHLRWGRSCSTAPTSPSSGSSPVRHLPPRRSRGRPHLRHRGGRHRGEPVDNRTLRAHRHRPLQVEGTNVSLARRAGPGSRSSSPGLPLSPRPAPGPQRSTRSRSRGRPTGTGRSGRSSRRRSA